MLRLLTIALNVTNAFSMEGSNISLSCTYTGSFYSLHWYRQKSGSGPEFLLLIHENSEHVTEAQPPHPRLSIQLKKYQEKMNKKVDLIISSATLHYTTVVCSPQ
ncbi:hypothetical protein QTP86_019141 [Hemibagrus guttatus]|nr:hypothetical protein QTP86_019141 [Hemibagrus guttatus]